jgi:predicted TIM-barrel enzyme
MPHFLKRLDDLGFSGINNFPTVGLIDGHFRAELEATNLGFDKEVETIRTAHELGFFTIVYVFNPEESARMAAAGADVIIAHMGLTVGGSIGLAREGGVAMRLEEAPAKVQAIGEAAWAVNRSCLLVSHGGPIATPDDARYVQERSDAVGFIGASSMERLPVETAITDTVRAFKEIPVRKRA